MNQLHNNQKIDELEDSVCHCERMTNEHHSSSSVPVLLASLPLPAQLGGDHSQDGALLAVGQHLARLPPLVVARVHHVQDVAVGEGQAPRRQTVVLV